MIQLGKGSVHRPQSPMPAKINAVQTCDSRLECHTSVGEGPSTPTSIKSDHRNLSYTSIAANNPLTDSQSFPDHEHTLLVMHQTKYAQLSDASDNSEDSHW